MPTSPAEDTSTHDFLKEDLSQSDLDDLIQYVLSLKPNQLKKLINPINFDRESQEEIVNKRSQVIN